MVETVGRLQICDRDVGNPAHNIEFRHAAYLIYDDRQIDPPGLNIVQADHNSHPEANVSITMPLFNEQLLNVFQVLKAQDWYTSLLLVHMVVSSTLHRFQDA